MTDESDELKGIPKGRMSRLGSYAGLATGVAGGILRATAQVAMTGSVEKAGAHLHQRTAERLAKSLGEMKGLPMKMGQMLSYIEAFVPAAHRELYRDTLAKLQSQTQPLEWGAIEATFLENMKADPKTIFADFDTKPIAAASIGQVYKATLLDGTPVAVKIQYPGIAKALRSDIKNTGSIIRPFIALVPGLDLTGFANDLSRRLLQECDYEAEAMNQELFRRLWAHEPRIVIPKVYHEYSGPQVLVSEFIDGQSWSDMLASSTPEEKSEYGETIFRFVYHSLYAFGAFNTDPHPGNYIFLPGGKTAFLDFGSIQRYDESTRQAFAALCQATLDEARGPRLRRAIDRAFKIPSHIQPDEALWSFFEEFTLTCAEPFVADQPYTYTHELVRRIAENTNRARDQLMKRMLKMGLWTPEQQGIVFMYRINFGLNSILADLGSRGHFRHIVDVASQTPSGPFCNEPPDLKSTIEALGDSPLLSRFTGRKPAPGVSS